MVLLEMNTWDKITKSTETPVTFFTNWVDYTELPTIYGSGIILPTLDPRNKVILFTNGVDLWLNHMSCPYEGGYSLGTWRTI